MERERRLYLKGRFSGKSLLNFSEEYFGSYESLDYVPNNINRLIEANNILEDLDLISPDMAKSLHPLYDEKIRQIKKDIGKGLSVVNDSNLLNYLNCVDSLYISDFWNLFAKEKLYLTISSEAFSKVLHERNNLAKYVIYNKEIVKKYSSVIKDFVKLNPDFIESICGNHMEDHHMCYIESMFSEEEIFTLLNDYINSESPNPNYLSFINRLQKIGGFSIPGKIRHDAIQRFNSEINKIHKSSKNPGFSFGARVSIQKQKEILKMSTDSQNTMNISYSEDYLSDTLSNFQILRNLYVLFGLVDSQIRINNVSHPANLSTIESILGFKTERDYPVGVGYQIKEMSANGAVSTYYNLLKSHSIELENVFKWFFEEYLLNHYDIHNFTYESSSSKTTYREKCMSISSQLDSVLKQYKSYVMYGYIDEDILQYIDDINFSDIPSSKKSKYIYGTKKMNRAISFLFMQAGVSYSLNTHKEYESFFIRCESEPTSIFDIPQYLIHEVNWLSQNKFIYFDSKSCLHCLTANSIIAYDLYLNETICAYYLSPDIQRNLLRNDFISYGDTLFSKYEINYFNYLLNHKSYNNGPNIRNKYIHGTNYTESENFNNYCVLLRVMVYFCFKIDQDLRFKIMQ